MSTEIKKKEYTIDAAGKKLGRVASEVATILMGKNDPSFERHELASVNVKVTNASQMDISARKKEGKEYITYTGYPGGLRKEKLGKRLEKKGHADVLQHAIRGMLPANRLRKGMLKNVTIEE